MPENGKPDERSTEGQSDIVFDSSPSHGTENDISDILTAWRSGQTEWKDRFDEFLPPGNYQVQTHETDSDTAHATVGRLFSEFSDYYIWRTEDVYSSAKARQHDDPPHKYILVRTMDPVPVEELPDTPQIVTW